MSPPTPSSDPSGPTVEVDPERAKPNMDPEQAEPDMDPERAEPDMDPERAEPDVVPEPSGQVAPAAKTIPDHDPFTDTDVYPELGLRPSTGGFAGLSRSTGQVAAAFQSSYQSPIGPVASAAGTGAWPDQPPTLSGDAGPTGGPPAHPAPTPAPRSFNPPWGPSDAGSAASLGQTSVLPVTPSLPPDPSAQPGLPQPGQPPHAAPTANPAAQADPTPSLRATGTDPPLGPPTGTLADSGRFAAAPVAWSAPANPPTPSTPPAPRSRQAFGRGPLLILGVLAAVVLLGLGALGGALLSSRNDSNVDLASPATTSERRTADTRGNPSDQTSRSQPLQPTTTAATASSTPTSALPTTAPTSAASPSSVDPNALVADFTWSPDPATAGRSITITDASTGNPNRWVWRWNGNTVSSSQPKGFTTSLREDTAITLTVCRGNGSGNCASVTKTVTVS